MNRYFAIILSLLLAAPLAIIAQDDNCMTCHLDFEDEVDGPSFMIVRDIHHDEGLSCSDCHGGDPSLEDMDEVRESKGYRGSPSHLEVPDFCARCHSNDAYMHEHNPSLPTDQLKKYKTSTHGKRLFKNRDTNVANCISCHSVHEISSGNMPHSSTHPTNIPTTCGACHANSELMAKYELPATQVDEFTRSVHGKALLERNDLGAPACNDCHGNHGAAPPGAQSVSHVCGNCHAIEAELFTNSPHQVAFEENDFPMCETCHSNHFIEKPFDALIGNAEPALCINCHEPGDGTKGLETAVSISNNIMRLRTAHEEAAVALAEATEKGMMTTDETFLLKEVKQSLILTRTQVHSFNADSVTPKAEAGLEKADLVKSSSAALIDEYYFRRKGLGLATIFITLLAIALYMKIRRLDD